MERGREGGEAVEDTYHHGDRGCHSTHIVVKLHDLLNSSLYKSQNQRGKFLLTLLQYIHPLHMNYPLLPAKNY